MSTSLSVVSQLDPVTGVPTCDNRREAECDHTATINGLLTCLSGCDVVVQNDISTAAHNLSSFTRFETYITRPSRGITI